jgi:fructosamine-3-kinase
MISPTKRALAPDAVAAHLRKSLGVEVVDCAELTGGGFAAVWRASLADGRRVVLKVGPEPHVRLLAYERGMIAAEAEYLRLVGDRTTGVPVPEVLHHDGEWLIVTELPGTALPDLPETIDVQGVRAASGAAIARVHAVTGSYFGYSGERAHASTWRGAYTAMVECLLADGEAWDVELPVPAGRIRAAVDRHGPALDTVDRPALLHFDLWDGNLLATVDGDVATLTGLVDGERYLYGDPLMDFSSPTLFRAIEEEPDHPFLVGYASVGGPIDLDPARLALGRLYLYLLMVVEMPSRAMFGPEYDPRRKALADILDRELTRLESR